ncbi:hypothetical protein [Nocardia sp. NPDC058633]|uniref:hypothetical protein n=1 Tax=Nocardia sp. NPDC058633 TaxID=3346568 RepID=UPI0036610747
MSDVDGYGTTVACNALGDLEEALQGKRIQRVDVDHDGLAEHGESGSSGGEQVAAVLALIDRADCEHRPDLAAVIDGRP